MKERFSLLMSVYAGTVAGELARALASSMDEQLRPPDELVVVRDGAVSDDVWQVVESAADRTGTPLRQVRLDRNVGLARALDRGLQRCSYDVVARMDSDDVSLPQRFARQLPVIEAGADLVGAGLVEFEHDEARVVARRTLPTRPADIARLARFRDPFNHPTVVYRRTAVATAGGYQDLPLMEDYWLFVRMIHGGARVANLAEPLVRYRIGAGAYERRGGAALLRSEILLQRRLLALGFTSRGQCARNMLVRGGYRFVPVALRRPVYRLLVTTRGEWLDDGPTPEPV